MTGGPLVVFNPFSYWHGVRVDTHFQGCLLYLEHLRKFDKVGSYELELISNVRRARYIDRT